MQGIDINDFLNHVYEKKINYKIILKDVYGIIADIMFIHGYYDAAFHYIQQSNLIYATNVEVHIYRERYEELSNNNKSWILNMEELITHITKTELQQQLQKNTAKKPPELPTVKTLFLKP